MGILLDINEDNAESEGWRIETKRRQYGIMPSESKHFPCEICPICWEKFFTNTDLQNHIFMKHREEYKHKHTFSENKKRIVEISSIDYTDIDNLFFDLQTKVYQGKTITDWSSYKKIIQKPDEHYLRKNYLKGLLEYIGAHYQEVCENYNDFTALSEQFGRADGYLKDFATEFKNNQKKINIPQQICNSIALKMNWFDNLLMSDYSLFFLAGHFFSESYEDVKLTVIPLIKTRKKEGIIIDDFHQELLEFLQLYYSHRSQLTYKNIEKLELLAENIKNPNYIDKLFLLKARLFREMKNFTQAQQNYRKIKNHYIFGKEANSFHV